MFVERLLSHTTFLLHVQQRKEQSQEEKSASKGTGSPFLCHVRERERKRPRGFSPDPEVPEAPSKQRKSDPQVGVKAMHLGVAGF